MGFSFISIRTFHLTQENRYQIDANNWRNRYTLPQDERSLSTGNLDPKLALT
jgi:hypothetical protein